MAISFDSFSYFGSPGASTWTTSTLTWLHIPAGAPKGVVVGVSTGLAGAALADEVVSVTYAGVGMTEMAASPVLFSLSTEAIATHAFFLGSGVPAGTATVVVTTSGTALRKVGWSIGIAADAAATELQTSRGASGATGSTSVTLTLGGNTCVVGLVASNTNNVSSHAAPAGWTERGDEDIGTDFGYHQTYNTVSNVDVVAFYDLGAAFTANIAYAIKEAAAAGGTTVTATAATVLSIGGTGALLSPSNIAGANATVVAAGQTATITEPTVIPATAGVVVAIGQQATLAEPTVIAATPGVVVVAGQQATLPEAASIQATAGVVVVTGQQATIVVATIIPATAGVVVVAGQTGSIEEAGAAVTVMATAAVVTAGGQDACIDQTQVFKARPICDGADNTAVPSVAGAHLYEMLDEEDFDDADYVSFPVALDHIGSIDLNSIPDPGISTGHVLRFRARSLGATRWLLVQLKQGATVIASKVYFDGGDPITADWATYSIYLTGAEADAITDYGDLNISASDLFGGAQISWIELLIEQATSVEATPATVVVGGEQATVRADTIIASSHGLVVVSGEQATISAAETNTVECSPGVLLAAGQTCTIEATSGLRSRRRKARYTTQIEPTAPVVPGTLPVDHGAAFGALAPALPTPAPAPAPRRPILTLKRKPPGEPAPMPPFVHNVVAFRAVVKAVDGPTEEDKITALMDAAETERARGLLARLADAVRHDPDLARELVKRLADLDDEEDLIRLLLRQTAA